MKDRYRGPLGWLRRWNSARRAKRRWPREALAALVEDDGVIMEAMGKLVDQGAMLAEVASHLERIQEAAEQHANRFSALDAEAKALGQALSRMAAAGASVEALGGRVDRLVAIVGQQTASLSELAGRLPPPPSLPGPDPFPTIVTARDALLEPELELIARLTPHLSPRVAVDVGAHHGRFTRALLDLGFEVHALEPNPTSRAELARRLEGRPGLTIYDAAAGSADAEAELALVADRSGRYSDETQFASLSGLPLPDGLVRAGTVRVPVRRLDALLRERGVRAPSLVKVDAEGMDLEVLRGLGELRPAMILAEFWDDALPFSAPGARNRLPDLVSHGQTHGAPWHLVVFRRWGDDRPAFYSGFASSPERSWGNVLQFADRTLFEKAREHLSTLLPEAHFVGAGK